MILIFHFLSFEPEALADFSALGLEFSWVPDELVSSLSRLSQWFVA